MQYRSYRRPKRKEQREERGRENRGTERREGQRFAKRSHFSSLMKPNICAFLLGVAVVCSASRTVADVTLQPGGDEMTGRQGSTILPPSLSPPQSSAAPTTPAGGTAAVNTTAHLVSSNSSASPFQNQTSTSEMTEEGNWTTSNGKEDRDVTVTTTKLTNGSTVSGMTAKPSGGGGVVVMPITDMTSTLNPASPTSKLPAESMRDSAAGYIILVFITLMIVVLLVILYLLRRNNKRYSFDLQRPCDVTSTPFMDTEHAGTFGAVHLDDMESMSVEDPPSSTPANGKAVDAGGRGQTDTAGDNAPNGDCVIGPQNAETLPANFSLDLDLMDRGSDTSDGTLSDAILEGQLNGNKNPDVSSSQPFVEISLDDLASNNSSLQPPPDSPPFSLLYPFPSASPPPPLYDCTDIDLSSLGSC